MIQCMLTEPGLNEAKRLSKSKVYLVLLIRHYQFNPRHMHSIFLSAKSGFTFNIDDIRQLTYFIKHLA